MITTLIEADDDPAGLSRTLASLVPGAVEGLIREVIVLSSESTSVAKVADHAGCRLAAPGDVDQIVSTAKGDWLLVLPSGVVLSPGWVEPVSDFLANAENRSGGGRFRPARPDRLSLMRWFRLRQDPLARGALVRRRDAARVGSKGLGSLAGGVRLREIAVDIRMPKRPDRA